MHNREEAALEDNSTNSDIQFLCQVDSSIRRNRTSEGMTKPILHPQSSKAVQNDFLGMNSQTVHQILHNAHSRVFHVLLCDGFSAIITPNKFCLRVASISGIIIANNITIQLLRHLLQKGSSNHKFQTTSSNTIDQYPLHWHGCTQWCIVPR